jgi:ribonuclease P protein component
VVYAAPNAGPAPRVGIVVGRRVGKAVVRNRVKRRLREALRQRWAEMVPGIDQVWIARPPSGEASYERLRAAVNDLLRRARLVGRSQPAAV